MDSINKSQTINLDEMSKSDSVYIVATSKQSSIQRSFYN